MAQFVRGFFPAEAASIYRSFETCITLAQRDGARSRATLAELRAARIVFHEGLVAAAAAGAVDAQKAMREAFDNSRSKSRGPTGKKPGLRSKLTARPVRVLGQPIVVGIANIDVLDKLRNEYSPGYGSYWRAQEYGTGTKEVRSQLDRVLYGFFVGKGGSGNPERPQAQYAGGKGVHPIFISAGSQRAAYGGLGFSGGAGVRGGIGGKGVIRREITPGNFIRDGANKALADYRQAVRQVEREVMGTLRAIALTPGGPPRRAPRARRS